jgi:hypothetical protein
MKLLCKTLMLFSTLGLPLSVNVASAQGDAAPRYLCQSNEKVVFGCTAGDKMLSLRASPKFTSTSGYMQYRFGTPTKIELTYPEARKPPKGYFWHSSTLYSGGFDERVRFKNQGVQYLIFDRMIRTGFDEAGNNPEMTSGVLLRIPGKQDTVRLCTGNDNEAQPNDGFLLGESTRLDDLLDNEEFDYNYTFDSPASPAKPSTAKPLQQIRARLGRLDSIVTPDNLPFGFKPAAELADAAKTAAANSKDPETKGEMELARLRAIQIALYSLPAEPVKRAAEPYASWLKAQGKQIFADEISGAYLVSADSFWKLADRYKKAAIGDAIAFHAANNALGGECEGSMACHSIASLHSEGEYLKRYPKGAYVDQAVGMVNGMLKSLLADWHNQPDERADTHLAEWEAILKQVDGKAAKQARQSISRLKTMK